MLAAIRIIVDRFLLLNPPEREWYLLHAEFQVLVVRDEAMGRAFAGVLAQVRTDFEAFIESVLEALGLRLTIAVSHAATILTGSQLALREAFVEGRALDESLLQEALPKLLEKVTEPAT
ncbi:hypothetical protein [Aeromicrobium sp. UC242_57]|uniref:hypothetical protein n=1 Tax=Aeromicrobium sp. UC242_57 TaxID=3374624 RepID=UPI0037C0385D